MFNDGAFETFTEKSSKKNETLMMEHGKPLVFGDTSNKGIKLDGFKPVVVDLNDTSVNDLWIHDETDLLKATILGRFYDDPAKENHFPRPFGVFFINSDKTPFEVLMSEQSEAAKEKGLGDLNKLIAGRETWVVN